MPFLTFSSQKGDGSVCLVFLILQTPLSRSLKPPSEFLNTQDNQPCSHFTLEKDQMYQSHLKSPQMAETCLPHFLSAF